jgi:hypothetical protein
MLCHVQQKLNITEVGYEARWEVRLNWKRTEYKISMLCYQRARITPYLRTVSSGLLRTDQLYFLTDVSGQPIGPIITVHKSKQILEPWG